MTDTLTDCPRLSRERSAHRLTLYCRQTIKGSQRDSLPYTGDYIITPQHAPVK